MSSSDHDPTTENNATPGGNNAAPGGSNGAGNGRKSRITGRVIMGLGNKGPLEMTVQEIEGKKAPAWDADSSDELVRRVREKAQAKAKEIIARAMGEAETLKQQAYQEAYNQGVSDAQQAIQDHSDQLSTQMGQILAAIQGQAQNVWAQQRQELTGLVRMAVEKTINASIAEQRAEILQNLLGEALDLIDSKRSLVLRVHPEDAQLVDEILTQAKERMEGLSGWKVQQNPEMAPGGVIVESADGMVDNSLETRYAEIAAIFDHLAASPGPIQE
jgi:flagellar assembly protein FliH